MDEGGEEGLAGTCFTDDDNGGQAVGEGGDPSPELHNCRAASYEVERGQRENPSGTGDTATASCVAAREKISCAEWPLDSTGLWTLGNYDECSG
jgi:hypothetical protein